MNKRKLYSIVSRGWILILSISILGCVGEKTELPTKGSIVIAVSETVLPMIRQQEEKFESLYTNAKIDIISASTREVITRIFNDTIKLIVSSRPLNQEEKEVEKRAPFDLQEYKIALDGIAVIVNAKNSVSQLRTTQLDSIFQGLTTRWSEVGGERKKIDIILPDPNAGEFEVVGTKILKGKKFGKAAKIVRSSSEMLEQVTLLPDAIGFVSVNWLKDKSEKLKVLELCDPSMPDSLGIKGQYFAPFQAHIYRGYYPITSEVYIYSRVDMYSVGSGFISFVMSAPGQKIVLDNGLVPVTMPVRLVELTNRGIKP